MSDDEFTEPKQKGKKPTRLLKKDKYEVLTIIIDCGPHMKKKELNGLTSFEAAKEAVDWILSRKIFTQSNDRINIVLAGATSTQNDLNLEHIYVKDDEMSSVSFDHIKFLQKEVEMTKNNGSVVDALCVAVDTMKKQTSDDPAVESKNLLLITNGESGPEEANKIANLANNINSQEISFVIMGMSCSSATVMLLENLVELVEGNSMSFDDASSTLHNFTHKKVASRAMKKNWEIAPGLSLPLAFHMRSTPAKNPIKAVTVNEKGEEVKREIQYFTKNKRADDEFADEDEEIPAAEQREKNDLVYGYLFGKSKVVLTEDDMAEYKGHNFNEGEKGGCLKLLQFTKKENIPPSFFLGNNSYSVVPSVDKKTMSRDEKLMNLTLSIIESMLDQDVVAVCRYAYHASAHLQLMALIPQREDDQLYFTAIRLPFMDDWRPFSLPDISLRGPFPSTEKITAIDELINVMDLSRSNVTYEDVLNPFFQRQCTMMKMKALKNMNCLDEINIEPSIFLKRGLEPAQDLLESKEFQRIVASLPELFNLEEVIRVKRKRRSYIAQNKDHLKGYDEADEEEEEEFIKEEIAPIEMPDPDGPHKKFWDRVRKALESGGTAINSWTNHVASDMSLFDEASLAAVEKYKILRAEMLAANRVVDFNQWLMSLHGNDEYGDFFQFMDSRNEAALITLEESSDSWYTTVESQMYWSGMLDDEKKK